MDIKKFLKSLTDEEKDQLRKVLIDVLREENKNRFLISDFIDVMLIRVKYDNYPPDAYTQMSTRLCSCLQSVLYYKDAVYLDEIEPYLIKLRNMGKKSVEEYHLLKPEFICLLKKIKDEHIRVILSIFILSCTFNIEHNN